MKFTITREQLQEGLVAVAAAIPAKTTLPVLANMLVEHVAFAASTEESRPILNGVLWELRPDRMRMVATNGHRLAKMDVPASGGSTAGLIVPPKALEQVRRLYAADAE